MVNTTDSCPDFLTDFQLLHYQIYWTAQPEDSNWSCNQFLFILPCFLLLFFWESKLIDKFYQFNASVFHAISKNNNGCVIRKDICRLVDDTALRQNAVCSQCSWDGQKTGFCWYRLLVDCINVHEEQRHYLSHLLKDAISPNLVPSLFQYVNIPM